MPTTHEAAPDSTAVRVALWRALHVEVDALPHVFEDEIGLRLAAPEAGWRRRADMEARAISGYRAAIVARSRFIEDLVSEHIGRGVMQYVILGAGLDSFAQRKPTLASRIRVFEIDQPLAQAWKRQRLQELGYGIPEWLQFVSVDFEAGEAWWERLAGAGFDMRQPAIVSSAGVSMYLTREANLASLRHLGTLAQGSTFAMTFLLPLGLLDPTERTQHEAVYERARAAGTPFLSFFAPPEILALAREAGFNNTQYVSTAELTRRYFTGRSDGLKPSNGEAFLVASR